MNITYEELYRNSKPKFVIQVRERAVKLYLQGNKTIKQVCKEFRMPRKTFHKWLKRFLKKGVEGLKDLSRRPKTIYKKVTKIIEEKIVEIRKKNKYFGPVRIKERLEEEISEGTIYNVLKKLGLNKRVNRRRLRKKPKTRGWNKFRNRKEWQMDFCHFRIKGHGKQYILIIKDAYTRQFVCLKVHSDRTKEKVIGSLDITLGQYVFPKKIWTDNEGAFISKDLEKFCKKSRVKLKHIKPGKPNENCIVERSVRTLREEVLDQYWFNNPEELQQALDEFKKKYNNRVFRRFKQTPNERYLDWIMNRKK